jgi:hypothetical protein
VQTKNCSFHFFCALIEYIKEYIGDTLGFLLQKRSLQTLFDDKVKGLVEELLHVDDSGRFVVFFLHTAILSSYMFSPSLLHT